MSGVAQLSSLRTDHPFWVVMQQVFLRGIAAVKFIAVGRLLGPEALGTIGVAMLALTIVESISDTGFSQAIVHHRDDLTPRERGAAWTLMQLRGLLLAVVLLVAAYPLALALAVPSSAGVLASIAIVPLLRNSTNLGYFRIQRARNFRGVSLLETGAACIDMATTLAAIHFGAGVFGIVIGMAAAELTKSLGTWLLFAAPTRPNLDFRSIADLANFGKWIWGSSILTLLLNQFDKVVVVRLLGATELGLYQMASKIAQLFIADGANALSQYLFPTFCQKFRSSPAEAWRQSAVVLWIVFLVAASVAAIIALAAPFIVSLLLGDAWLSCIPVLRVLLITMTVGAMLTVLATLARASGQPKIVTQATLVQLISLVLCAPILTYLYKSQGLAISLALAGLASALTMYFKLHPTQRVAFS